MDYGDIIYGQAYHVSFHRKLESIQYDAALAITGAIRGTLQQYGTISKLPFQTYTQAEHKVCKEELKRHCLV